MSDTRAPRGRPKGSGIDDSQRLDAIARLIASNPQLKPTTAIRAIGVSDPSVIRRLRDKFNTVRIELMQELQASATPARSAAAIKTDTAPAAPTTATAPRAHAPAAAAAAPRRASRTRAIAAAKPAAKARVAAASVPGPAPAANTPARTATPRDTAPAPARSPAHKSDDDSDRAPARNALPPAATQFFTTMFSVGVLATNTLMAAHTTMANEFFRSPYMSLALRQQLAFSEWAVGLVPTSPPPTKTAT